MKRIIISLLPIFLFLNCFSQDYYLFIGTYTSGKARAFMSTNSMRPTENSSRSVRYLPEPSYLTISPNGKYVYAVNENGSDQDGGVSAFSFDKSNGQLKFIKSAQVGVPTLAISRRIRLANGF
jgi:6-phosphogluconolactonase